MITKRPSNERGHADHGWLDTYHSFSFADYYDPRHQGFRSLRVINEDRVAPGMGFGMHPHRDMEIVTYVIEGALAHRDSMGNGEVLRPGEIQVMTAGTGIEHSEFNPSDKEAVHLVQIWIRPAQHNLPPAYAQKNIGALPENGVKLLVSADASNGGLKINQDASVYIGRVGMGNTFGYALAPHRHAWLQLLRGALRVNGAELRTGDGAAISGEPQLSLTGLEDSEFLLFDLA